MDGFMFRQTRLGNLEQAERRSMRGSVYIAVFVPFETVSRLLHRLMGIKVTPMAHVAYRTSMKNDKLSNTHIIPSKQTFADIEGPHANSLLPC